MPRRYRLHGAYYASSTKAITRTSGDEDAWEAGLATAAALGLCWAGEALECPDLRACRYEVGLYGEHVLDVLIGRGYGIEQVMAAGRECRRAIFDSIPTKKEIKETTDPSPAPEENSIETTSQSA